MMKKRMALFGFLVLALALLCACRSNPTEKELFGKLIRHFEQYGYRCELSRLADSEPDRAVPIYKASAWHKLMLDGEEVLVYFDESNRADYLSGPIDESVYGRKARFGLRFVLIYEGQDAGVLNALKAMPQ